jgi:ribosomal protein L31
MRASTSLQAYQKVGFLRRSHDNFPLRESLSTALKGRTHRPRPLGLPPASPPLYPQQVVLADGSSFTHWTTSPRSVYKLTKDLSNHPMWYPNRVASRDLQDEFGRIGRFRQKYAGFNDGEEGEEGGSAFVGELEDWMSEGATETKEKMQRVRSALVNRPGRPLPRRAPD